MRSRTAPTSSTSTPRSSTLAQSSSTLTSPSSPALSAVQELPSYPLVTLRAKPGTRPKTLRLSSRDPALADYYIAPKARAHEKSKYYAISKGHNVGVFRNW